jgi:hypothetical protein
MIEATIRIFDSIRASACSRHVERANEYQDDRRTFDEKALKFTPLYGRPRY